VANVLETASATPNVELPSEVNVDLPTDAKESALASGRFTLPSVDLQAEVSQMYAAVERAREYRGKSGRSNQAKRQDTMTSLLSFNYLAPLCYVLQHGEGLTQL